MRKMKKNVERSVAAWGRLVLLFLVIFCLAYTTDCDAANTKASKAKKAYASFLEKHPPVRISDSNFYDAAYKNPKTTAINSFIVHDLDKDKIPELITYTPVNFRWYIVRIYTYRKGKVIKYKFSNGKAAVFDNCAVANGGYTFYIGSIIFSM